MVNRGFFALILRVRVNYSISDICRAIFITGNSSRYRKGLIAIIQNYFGSGFPLLTGSGRGSLYQLLIRLPQKKVVIPGYICDAVYEAVSLTGKQIVFADTSDSDFNLISDNLNLDSDTIVVAPHQYGFPCDILAIKKKCDETGAILIEDCAGALGTEVSGRKAGQFVDFGFFSFDSSKLINVPSKGGFILCNNPKYKSIIEDIPFKESNLKFKIKHLGRGFIYCLLKNAYAYRVFHYFTMGRKGQLHISEEVPPKRPGDFYIYPMAEWQCYFAVSQWKKIDEIISKRQKIFNYYNENLCPKYTKFDNVNDAVCIRYPILVKNRVSLYRTCVEQGVDFNFSFSHINCPKSMVREHSIADRIMNLPFYTQLSDKELRHIVDVLNSNAEKNNHQELK